MKLLFISVFTCLSLIVTSQESASWDGNFKAEILGVPTAMTAQREGSLWTATIDAEGYIYNLEGHIEGLKCKGTLTDPQVHASIPFSADLSGNQIIININPDSDPRDKMEIVFTNSDQSLPSPSTKPSGVKGNLDQRLVGNWRYTDTYVSGTFSFATDYFMQFNPDGTMLWTDGRTAGGGPDISMDSGTGDVHSATWKIENKIIWLDGGNGWEHYAKYYEEKGSLLLTFQNGNKQVWEKL